MTKTNATVYMRVAAGQLEKMGATREAIAAAAREVAERYR